MCSSLNRAFALVLLSLVLSVQGAFAEYAFEQGDSIAIIGNALPDRMQQDGYLETYLQLANPVPRCAEVQLQQPSVWVNMGAGS